MPQSFASLWPAEKKNIGSNKKQKENLPYLDKIQNNLLGYILEIEYSRVQTTQKHIF